MSDSAKNSVRGLKDQDATEDALPDTVLSTADAALFVPMFAMTARISLLNGEPDVAADLCEAVAAVGSALRNTPPAVSTALLRRGVGCASSVIDLVGVGIWTIDPTRAAVAEPDVRLAAHLQADLDAVKSRLRYRP